MICPNINLPEWEKLLAEQGEARAYYLWNLYEGNVPAQQAPYNRPDESLGERYFPEGDRRLSDLLQDVSKSGHPLAEMAGQLSRYAHINNVPVRLVDNIEPGTDGPAMVNGAYRWGRAADGAQSRDILIAKNGRFPKGRAEGVILHEAMHALTLHYINERKFEPAVKDLEKLYQAAKGHFRDRAEHDINYPLSNLDEFVAGVFTNALFIRELSKLPPVGLGGKYHVHRNLFGQIFDRILSFFGLNGRPSLHRQAVSVISQVLESSGMGTGDPFTGGHGAMAEGAPFPEENGYSELVKDDTGGFRTGERYSLEPGRQSVKVDKKLLELLEKKRRQKILELKRPGGHKKPAPDFLPPAAPDKTSGGAQVQGAVETGQITVTGPAGASQEKVKEILKNDKNGPENKGAVTINIYAGTGENPGPGNFATRPFVMSAYGAEYRSASVENAFHAMKLSVLKNMDSIPEEKLKAYFEKILGASPAEAKRLGSKKAFEQEGFELDVEKWDALSRPFMQSLVYQSFEQDPEAREQLLRTGDARIVHEGPGKVDKWTTLFPEVLMEVREVLRTEGAAPGARQGQGQPSAPPGGYELFPGIFANSDQRGAIDKFRAFLDPSDKRRVATLQGMAGTGKTTIIKKIIENIPDSQLLFLAPTHNALTQLKRGLGAKRASAEFATVASAMNKVLRDGKLVDRRGSGPPPVSRARYIIVDEVSMVGDETVRELLDMARPDVKIIGTGDHAQLLPPGQKKTSSFFDYTLHVLTRVERQGTGSPLLKNIMQVRQEIEGGLSKRNPIPFERAFRDPVFDPVSNSGIIFEQALPFTLEMWHRDFKANPEGTAMVTYNNEFYDKSPISVRNLNLRAREMLYPGEAEEIVEGELLVASETFYKEGLENASRYRVVKAGPVVDHVILVGDRKYGEPEQVPVRARELLLENVLTGRAHRLMVPTFPEMDRLRALVKTWKSQRGNKKRQALGYALEGSFPLLTYAYALTVRRSQGTTLRNVYLMENNITERYGTVFEVLRSLYTGMSRASDKLVVYNPKNLWTHRKFAADTDYSAQGSHLKAPSAEAGAAGPGTPGTPQEGPLQEGRGEGNEGEVPFQKLSGEQGRKVSVALARDIALKLSRRLGVPYRFVDDPELKFKGMFRGGVAIINLAHATQDTMIHEIAGHPIIRALRQERANNKLFDNLLKELEHGRGKEVLDRIKRDYPLTKTYTGEDQKEEALVELLGLYTSERLDRKKEGRLITLLRKLLGKVRGFVKDLMFSKKILAKDLPEDLNLGELADLLAYSNLYIHLPKGEKQPLVDFAEHHGHIMEKMYEVLGYGPAPTLDEKARVLELYDRYLETVFPESQVKNIVYHGSPNYFEEFDMARAGLNTGAPDTQGGIFFGSSVALSGSYLDLWNKPLNLRSYLEMHPESISPEVLGTYNSRHGDGAYTVYRNGRVSKRFEMWPDMMLEGTLDDHVHKMEEPATREEEVRSAREKLEYREKRYREALEAREQQGDGPLPLPMGEPEITPEWAAKLLEYAKADLKKAERYEPSPSLSKLKGLVDPNDRETNKRVRFLELYLEREGELKGKYDENARKHLDYDKSVVDGPFRHLFINAFLLDIKRPGVFSDGGQKKSSQEFRERIQATKEKDGDGVLVQDTYDGYHYNPETVYVVFDTSQVHRLGSDKDVEMFAEFVKKQPREPEANVFYSSLVSGRPPVTDRPAPEKAPEKTPEKAPVVPEGPEELEDLPFQKIPGTGVGDLIKKMVDGRPGDTFDQCNL